MDHVLKNDLVGRAAGCPAGDASVGEDESRTTSNRLRIGGARHIKNIQPLCKPCTVKKGARVCGLPSKRRAPVGETSEGLGLTELIDTR